MRTIRCPIQFRVLRPTLAMVNILRLSIEAGWSELHTFASIIWQTGGRGPCAVVGAVKSALEARDNARLRYAVRMEAQGACVCR
jgi:hypothetical protein